MRIDSESRKSAKISFNSIINAEGEEKTIVAITIQD